MPDFSEWRQQHPTCIFYHGILVWANEDGILSDSRAHFSHHTARHLKVNSAADSFSPSIESSLLRFLFAFLVALLNNALLGGSIAPRLAKFHFSLGAHDDFSRARRTFTSIRPE